MGGMVVGHLLKSVTAKPDLEVSALECCVGCAIAGSGCFLIAWEIVGVMRYSDAKSELCPLKGWTLTAIIVNPIIAIITFVSVVVAQVCILPMAVINEAKDLVSGDDSEDHDEESS